MKKEYLIGYGLTQRKMHITIAVVSDQPPLPVCPAGQAFKTPDIMKDDWRGIGMGGPNYSKPLQPNHADRLLQVKSSPVEDL